MTGDQADGEEAFEEWYAAEAPKVLLTLRAALGERALAEDAVAEGFARAYAKWSKVSKMDSPTGWVFVVALNHARTLARQRTREQAHAVRFESAQTVQGPEPDGPVWRTVAELSPASRMAVALRYIADLPEVEVARLMGVSRGTVATTLHRARKTLAERLQVGLEGRLN
jgi:RNA polymerase sigma factor (sigma-70 family)